MRNTAVSRERQPESVAAQDLIDVMNPRKSYTQDEVCALLSGRPKMAVRDTLAQLVNKGIIWRDASGARVRYSLPDGENIQETIARKTTVGPSNFGPTIQGYDESLTRLRDACMRTRK